VQITAKQYTSHNNGNSVRGNLVATNAASS
jgi:hypothetical protein